MMPPTGLPIDLVTHLKDALGISTFIETGTGRGRTLSIVKEMFETVYSIELNYDRWAQIYSAHHHLLQVFCLLGDTLEVLPEVLAGIERQSVIFLDAHCAVGAVGETSCPLLGEIAIVLSHRLDHIIIIDDWSSFASFPTNVDRRHEWPEMAEVIDALRVPGHNPFIFECEGNRISRPLVLVSVPRSIKPIVESFWYGDKL